MLPKRKILSSYHQMSINSFKGVVGKVARYHGQQRVAVIIDGLLTIASAYVPTAFLEKNEENT